MKNEPIVIPEDILAKYEGQERQFETFDAAFQTAMNVPSSSIPPPPENETGEDGKPVRGRPRKVID